MYTSNRRWQLLGLRLRHLIVDCGRDPDEVTMKAVLHTMECDAASSAIRAQRLDTHRVVGRANQTTRPPVPRARSMCQRRQALRSRLPMSERY